MPYGDRASRVSLADSSCAKRRVLVSLSIRECMIGEKTLVMILGIQHR
jgi:hypothetical protein